MAAGTPLQTDVKGSIRRREILTASKRLPECDTWREKILADLGRIEPMMDATWSHKAIKDNFQRWLTAPKVALRLN